MGMASGTQPLAFGHSVDAAVDIQGLAVRLFLFCIVNKSISMLHSCWKIIYKNFVTRRTLSSGKMIKRLGKVGMLTLIQATRNRRAGLMSTTKTKTCIYRTAKTKANQKILHQREGPILLTHPLGYPRSQPLKSVHNILPLRQIDYFCQILTPADFALLNDLRIQAATQAVEATGGSRAKRKLATLEANKKAVQAGQQPEESFISENDILGPRKKAKSDYAERMASIAKGREGREKFGSHKGKKNKETPSSSTNREKARNKPIMMILGSNAVRGKKKASLREKQQKLRAHINKSKK
jgi:hypothetical protein